MRKLLRKCPVTLHRNQLVEEALAEKEVAVVERQEPEWVVWLTVALALMIGFWLQLSASREMQTVQVGDGSITYPADWSPIAKESRTFTAADLTGGGPFGTRVTITQLDKRTLLTGKGGLWEAAVNWTIDQSRKLPGYRVLSMNQTQVQGQNAISIESAYLQEIGPNQMPGLMHGIDTMILNGNKFFILSFATQENQFEATKNWNDKFLKSWRFKKK